MATGPTREESTQFSLNELLKLEDERIAEQRNAQKLAEEMRAREVTAAEARARKSEGERAEADRAAKEQARKAELDEVARREAMQKAIVEQARLAVDVKARAEERELERKHEAELARLRSDAKKGDAIPIAVAALLGGVVTFLVGLAVVIGVTKPAEARALAEETQRTVTAETRATDASRRVDEQRRMIASLEDKLRTSEAQLAARDRDHRIASDPPAPPSSVGAPHPTHPTGMRDATPPPPPPKICQKGDPLCGTIGVP